MKSILTEQVAIIVANDVIILEHPTMIFTDEWVNVKKYKTIEMAVKDLSSLDSKYFLEKPNGIENMHAGVCYKIDGKVTVITKTSVFAEALKILKSLDDTCKML